MMMYNLQYSLLSNHKLTAKIGGGDFVVVVAAAVFVVDVIILVDVVDVL